MPLALGAVGALVAALAVALWFVMASTAGGAGQAGGSAPTSSTPRAEWRTGEVPFLYQTDPQWAGHPYAGGTVEKNGCGPTCLSMVYVSLTGRDDLAPSAMADFSERGGYTTDGMTAWALMTDGAAELGLVSEELPASAGAVREALAAAPGLVCVRVPAGTALERMREAPSGVASFPVPWKLSPAAASCISGRARTLSIMSGEASSTFIS